MDYLCDEIVAFIDARYPTIADRDHRGLAGKSSGGYGAMVVPMLRPDVFGALASHAGDALFECLLPARLPDVAARTLRDNFDGSYEVFFEQLAEADHFDWGRFGKPFEVYGYACAYTPGSRPPGRGAAAVRHHHGPADRRRLGAVAGTGPGADGAGHADALRSMRRIYLDAGKSDEWFLDLGAQAFAQELEKLGVEPHARAVRRQARRDHVSLPGGDPRAR